MAWGVLLCFIQDNKKNDFNTTSCVSFSNYVELVNLIIKMQTENLDLLPQ